MSRVSASAKSRRKRSASSVTPRAAARFVSTSNKNLLRRLGAVESRNVTFVPSSGAEAVESALKTARLYTGKPGVIAFQGAYHGLSYGTLGLTDRKEFSAPFRDQLAPTVVHMPFPDRLRGPNDEEALKSLAGFLASGGKSHAGPISAILFEPVQGRGGVRLASPFFLKGLRDIARKHHLLLIADEIMTGLGRTGRTFAVEHAGI